MRCRQARKLIPKHVDCELDESTARELRSHLAECVACRKAEAQLSAVLGLLENWRPVEPQLGFEALEDRIQRRGGTVPGEFRQPVFGVPGWAAAALAALSILAGTLAAYEPNRSQVAAEVPSESQVASALNLRSLEGVVEDYLINEIEMGTDGSTQGGGSL